MTREATCSQKEQVQIEGGREVKRNLDVIIAVGYRVNSKKATKFRQWATKTLKEYITNATQNRYHKCYTEQIDNLLEIVLTYKG